MFGRAWADRRKKTTKVKIRCLRPSVGHHKIDPSVKKGLVHYVMEGVRLLRHYGMPSLHGL